MQHKHTHTTHICTHQHTHTQTKHLQENKPIQRSLSYISPKFQVHTPTYTHADKTSPGKQTNSKITVLHFSKVSGFQDVHHPKVLLTTSKHGHSLHRPICFIVIMLSPSVDEFCNKCIPINGYFLCWYPVTSYVIHLLCQMQFLRLEFNLHTLVVARSGKLALVESNLLLTRVCMKFEYITKLLFTEI